MPQIGLNIRHRTTPFTEGVEANGVASYSIYNHMLLPVTFRGLAEDYRHLKSAVQIWDVSCERQVEVSGPDAGRLVQYLTPRNLAKMKDDQCVYIPVVDERGGMLNDPVALRVGEDRWWVSIADSDLRFWINGLAQGLKMDVRVHEPDVSPLAIQGPLADDLMARVFGDQVRDIRFFRYKRLEFQGQSFVTARSGYSKSGGFEIYVEGSQHGMPLWNALMEAGRDLDARAGCPNLPERVEGGLLSYGGDVNQSNTPFECGLGKYCTASTEHDFIGKAALARAAEEGPKRQIRALAIDGDTLNTPRIPWKLSRDGVYAGHVTSAAYAPDFKTIVSISMIEADHWDAGTELTVATPEGPRRAVVQESFWT